MRIKYQVTLNVEEREQLAGMIGTGKAAARKLQHARITIPSKDWLGTGSTGWSCSIA